MELLLGTVLVGALLTPCDENEEARGSRAPCELWIKVEKGLI